MNVEIGAEAVQFPETECINGIFIAVRQRSQKINICLCLYQLMMPECGLGFRSCSVKYVPMSYSGVCLHRTLKEETLNIFKKINLPVLFSSAEIYKDTVSKGFTTDQSPY
jgi:hypothetical protein